MKKLFFIAVLCLTCLGAGAQEPLKLTTRQKPLLSRPVKDSGTSGGFFFMFDSFLTPDFQVPAAAKALNTGGLGLNIEFALFAPFYLQIDGFASMLTVKETTNGVDPGDFWRLGGEAYLNWHVLPYLGSISNWLVPYIGAGYQLSSIKIQDTRYNTSAPMLQACLRLNLSAYYFEVAYRQSLPLPAFKPQRIILFGGGFSF